MAESNEIIVFGDKTLADLMKEAHSSHKKKEKQMEALIDQISGMIANIADVMTLTRPIQDYLDLMIKNDDVKMKMIMVIVKANQRVKEEGTGDFALSEQDKAELRSLYDSSQVSFSPTPVKQLSK